MGRCAARHARDEAVMGVEVDRALRTLGVRLALAGQAGLSDILCVGPFDHHAVTNRASNMMANCVFASDHSRGGIFQSAAT